MSDLSRENIDESTKTYSSEEYENTVDDVVSKLRGLDALVNSFDDNDLRRGMSAEMLMLLLNDIKYLQRMDEAGKLDSVDMSKLDKRLEKKFMRIRKKYERKASAPYVKSTILYIVKSLLRVIAVVYLFINLDNALTCLSLYLTSGWWYDIMCNVFRLPKLRAEIKKL